MGFGERERKDFHIEPKEEPISVQERRHKADRIQIEVNDLKRNCFYVRRIQ